MSATPRVLSATLLLIPLVLLGAGTANAQNCISGWAFSLVSYQNGANQAGTSPGNALTSSSQSSHNLGDGGCLEIAFQGDYTTNGSTSSWDVRVHEVGQDECYFVHVGPADSFTENALQAAGLSQTQGNLYQLPALFCGRADVDIDTFVPGFASNELNFSAFKVEDDGDGGDGAEIERIHAKLVCPAIPGRIGDRVWVDVNCDGIQDANELSLGGIVVTLYDATGSVQLDQTTTDANGHYEFIVAPGSYVVCVDVDPALYTVTAPGVGGDPTLDSDINPATGMTEPIIVGPGVQRTDIDAGLCLVCVGLSAMADPNYPACGDPLDPVLSAMPPALGSIWTLTLTSQFPNAVVLVFLSPGAPQVMPLPGTTCNLYIDLNVFLLVAATTTDANGSWSLTLPIAPVPALEGAEFTFQARICEPAIPGPIPGFPDWLSNGIHLRLGCL